MTLISSPKLAHLRGLILVRTSSRAPQYPATMSWMVSLEWELDHFCNLERPDASALQINEQASNVMNDVCDVF